MLHPTTREIAVTTHQGNRITVVEVTHWIDTSDKDGPSKAPGRKELRTMAGQRIAFDGDTFTLPNHETFSPPQA